MSFLALAQYLPPSCLLQIGAETEARRPVKSTSKLMDALKCGDTKLADSLLNTHRYSMVEVDQDGISLFQYATMNNSIGLETIKRILVVATVVQKHIATDLIAHQDNSFMTSFHYLIASKRPKHEVKAIASYLISVLRNDKLNLTNLIKQYLPNAEKDLIASYAGRGLEFLSLSIPTHASQFLSVLNVSQLLGHQGILEVVEKASFVSVDLNQQQIARLQSNLQFSVDIPNVIRHLSVTVTDLQTFLIGSGQTFKKITLNPFVLCGDGVHHVISGFEKTRMEFISHYEVNPLARLDAEGQKHYFINLLTVFIGAKQPITIDVSPEELLNLTAKQLEAIRGYITNNTTVASGIIQITFPNFNFQFLCSSSESLSHQAYNAYHFNDIDNVQIPLDGTFKARYLPNSNLEKSLRLRECTPVHPELIKGQLRTSGIPPAKWMIRNLCRGFELLELRNEVRELIISSLFQLSKTQSPQEVKNSILLVFYFGAEYCEFPLLNLFSLIENYLPTEYNFIQLIAQTWIETGSTRLKNCMKYLSQHPQDINAFLALVRGLYLLEHIKNSSTIRVSTPETSTNKKRYMYFSKVVKNSSYSESFTAHFEILKNPKQIVKDFFDAWDALNKNTNANEANKILTHISTELGLSAGSLTEITRPLIEMIFSAGFELDRIKDLSKKYKFDEVVTTII